MQDAIRHAYEIVAKMSRHKKPYFIRMLGRRILVLPGVFSPKYVSDVKWFARKVPRIVGKRSFLEIGTGTGVITLFVALNGTKNIITTDINAQAVKNARRTFRLHKLSIPVRVGNVFEPIKKQEKFNVIFWNHPFHYTKRAKNALEKGGYDYQYGSLRSFFRDAGNHLTANGEVLLGTSKNARLDVIRALGREYGYVQKLIKQAETPSEHRKGVKIDVRIYSFRLRK